MASAVDASKAQLRGELAARVREALEVRDWVQLEHWAKQWVQLDAKHPSGFKWLARAALAQKQMPRAAYAYGRLLDFEPENAEARAFFTQNPSTLTEQPARRPKTAAPAGSLAAAHAPVVTPEQRQELAELELKLGEGYFRHRLFREAAAAYRRSFDWRPTQAAALGVARGLHHSQQGFDATRFLREQLYHFPDWIDGRILLGRVFFEIGQKAEAQREWQLALELDPKNEQALGFLRLLMSSV